jgi:ribosomal protein S18 acetylase RimI-like enzyme
VRNTEGVEIAYEWRGTVADEEVEALHAEGFDHAPWPAADWLSQLERHSLGWVCAREEPDLVGFVNVAWDGASHAFVLDTVVARSHQRRHVGTQLVAVAAREAAAAGCEWLHVDFDEELRGFYVASCGFTPAPAGLLRLARG